MQPLLDAVLPHCQHSSSSTPGFILLLFFLLQPSLGIPSLGPSPAQTDQPWLKSHFPSGLLYPGCSSERLSAPSIQRRLLAAGG